MAVEQGGFTNMGEEFKGLDDAGGALVSVERSRFMPALTIESAVERYQQVTEFVSRVLREDVDYGVIPGTEKRTLLKPGAEKLTTFFGLSTRFRLLERIEDWTGDEHGGEPFFYYLYRCQLLRGDLLIAEADASCNSRETKYRWREAQRTCPACGQAAIIKGREEYGGGWVCFRKRGGCGAKYADGDESIEGQQTGRVFNPDICDQVNTIQKMAQKRSLVGAVLIAVNASEFFTQDVEDFPARGVAARADSNAADLAGEIRAACRALGKTEEQLAGWIKKKYGADGVEQLTGADRRVVLSLLQGMLAKRAA
ncbi:MAG: hypothetical protein M3444_00315 [Acidobacteriota bacterium]|nr:hypothetical protein [Acidobacteriota bacterium]MDQ5838037.1 hypothetical protein [Acidobacteriota bacterium]